MTGFIRKYLVMGKSNTLIKSLFIAFLCLGVFLGAGLGAEPGLFIDAGNSTGGWKKGTVTQREVAFTDKPNISSEIKLYVSHRGKYQLIAYVHHNWRKSFPCIYVEAVDSAGKLHRGYHKIENIWYLGPEDKGRWFFVSLSGNPYWDLPEGALRLKFWAEAEDNPWSELSVPMEDKLSIAYFFLLPVVDADSGPFLPWLLNIESGTGNWQACEYGSEYATDFIRAVNKNASFFINVNIPATAGYSAWLSVLSKGEGTLEMRIKNGSREQKSVIGLKAAKTWNLFHAGPFKLNKGPCSIYFKNLDQNELMLDFFLLTPELSVPVNP